MKPYYERGQVSLYHADMNELLGEWPEGTVDVIHTDPPYLKEHLHLYALLGAQAARVLAPSGVLLAIVPHVHLPAIMPVLGRHLTYRWLVAMLQQDGSQARYPGRGWCLRITYKPVGLWTKGAIPPVGRVADSFLSPRGDKSGHRWQQSLAWGEYGLRWLRPGGHLLDPFAGTGTALVAALQAGAKATGIECDERACETAARRLEAVTL